MQTTIKDNWRRFLLGEPTQTDLTDENTLQMLRVLDVEAGE